MKLEDEIKQKHFKSPQQKLAINILYTSNWLNTIFSSHFKAAGITSQQFNVLRILLGQHPNYCNLKLIKERMLDKMSDASRIADKLFTKGLLHRTECPDDRRQVNILISDKGIALIKSLEFIEEETKNVFKNLSPSKIETLNSLLDEMRNNSK